MGVIQRCSVNGLKKANKQTNIPVVLLNYMFNRDSKFSKMTLQSSIMYQVHCKKGHAFVISEWDEIICMMMSIFIHVEKAITDEVNRVATEETVPWWRTVD